MNKKKYFDPAFGAARFLVVQSTQSVHHMQKALFEMNVQLSNVISDIVGESGMRILEAILAGEHDPAVLATLCSPARYRR